MTHMLRVAPHPDVGDLPVPMPGGRKFRRSETPEGGYLVADDIYVRRRIMFRELVLLAEGADALPKETAPQKPVEGTTP